MASATHTETFNCTPEQFYSIIVDYEKYPEFLTEVKKVKVLKNNEGVKDVEYNVFLIKNLTYLNKHREVENKEIHWEFVKGDVFKSMQGSWKLEPVGGKTKATYFVEAQFGMWVPSAVTKVLLETNLPSMMKAYHERIKKLFPVKA